MWPKVGLVLSVGLHFLKSFNNDHGHIFTSWGFLVLPYLIIRNQRTNLQETEPGYTGSPREGFPRPQAFAEGGLRQPPLHPPPRESEFLVCG